MLLMIIHNTLGRTDEKFIEFNKKRINIFVCGPTVQDDFHIGHARTNIFFDVMVKFLRAEGFSVFYLQNITDIDDKIIKKANEENKKSEEVADYYYNEYLRLMNLLKANSVTYYAKATLYMKEIINQIRRIIKKGYAYETSDGVYFDVHKFKDYGKLSNQNLEEIKENARGILNEDKRNPEDFVLWKKMKPGEPYWNSPWGKGRPGWHIEDTAITETFFGYEYDIHGGGADLIFPHHEAEIAQMRSISKRKYLARYWIHTGMVNVNEEKMSKSLKNYIKIKDILNIYSPEALRLALINSNYNTSIEYSDAIMKDSSETIEKINIFYNKVKSIDKKDGPYNVDYSSIIDKFDKIMENNFDTRSLIREMLEFIGDINKNYNSISVETADKIIGIMDYLNSFLCILYDQKGINDNIIKNLIEIRNTMRKNRMYDISDYIRKTLLDNGIYIEDNGDTTIWWTKH